MARLTDKNRLSITHPELCKEWDYENNLAAWEKDPKHPRTPEEVSKCSNKKAWRKCAVCGHYWLSSISAMTRGRGCPCCAGKVVHFENSLYFRYPKISKEWVCCENASKSPEQVTCGSSYKVWWKCAVCGHMWESSIGARTRQSCGCPACSGRVVSDKNRMSLLYPEVAEEWSYERNGFSPEDVSFGSNKSVWWECKKCTHEWVAVVNDRTSGQGCPSCAGKVVLDSNRLSIVYPEVAKEWCTAKNSKLSSEVHCFSNRKYWWACRVCGHTWKAKVSNRTANKSGCPSCIGRHISEKNRLSSVSDFLSSEWDYDKNFSSTPNDVSYGCKNKVWWECSECSYSWQATVNSRYRGNGCPHCSAGPVSRISNIWLDSFDLPQKNREVLLPKLGIRVDAYDPETNTVFEFLGDYWHGNPNGYVGDEDHPVCKKTFGQLFDETIERLFLLRRSGYNLNIIWEEDFRKL